MSQPNLVARSTSGWFEEDEPTNPKDVAKTASSPDVVRMDVIDDYEAELENELAERIGQLTTTELNETDRKEMLAAVRSRELHKKHLHRANEEQQKLKAQNKKMMPSKEMMRGGKPVHPNRAQPEQRGSYTGSLEEQRSAGCKIVSKKHTIDLDEGNAAEEAQMMAMIRMKQLSRQSWQDLDEVGSESTPSKLHALEHGV